MNTQFSFTRSADGVETIVIMGSQGVRVISDSHANFPQIRAALLVSNHDEAEVYALADAAQTVTETLMRLSDRVLIRGDKIFFDGDEMESRLTRHIVDMIRNGDDNYTGYVAFLENVKANPSKSGRKGLFRFIEKNGLVITEDGCFIGYKGISQDGLSQTAGSEDVTVTLADGTVEVHKGRIPNPAGAVVEMPRSLVDPDRETACSVGLHVGDYDYASKWASRLLTVKVNPRDVVEVPNDTNGQKLRASRYTVLEVNDERTEYAGTSYLVADGLLDAGDYDDGYNEDNYLGL